VVWVVPLPRCAPIVIISIDPAQSFNIGLPNFFPKILEVLFTIDFKLLRIVPFLPSNLAEFDSVLVIFNFSIIDFVDLFVNNFF
jgi:hypothetical protein